MLHEIFILLATLLSLASLIALVLATAIYLGAFKGYLEEED